MDISQRSLAGVLKDVGQNIEDILRSEVLLAKAEVRENTTLYRPIALQMISGAVLVAFSILFFLLGAMYYLSLYLAVWQAALVVGTFLGAMGVPVVLSAKSKFSLGSKGKA